MLIGGSVPSGIPDTEPGEKFLAAAIGGAAGGIEATAELLRHLDGRPGLALIVVSSVVSAHEVVEALARATPLPVSIVESGARLAADHVYVVPPHVELRVTDRVVQLERRVDPRSSVASLDAVFEAVADDFGARSIGVVLSGGGSDGSAGVRRIRMAGGFTFAQDATAEQRAMPEAAIASGCVDFVASAAGIAKQLLLLGHPPEAPPVAGDASDREARAFEQLLAAIARESGIDFGKYRRATLRRRVQRRMLLRRATRVSEYAELVAREPEEARALAEDALIHVTAFFRDAAVFEALDARVFPELLDRRRAGEPIRVWVPACSTGEEAYSIAIQLTEFLDRRGVRDIPIKVFGTDVSPNAIRHARAARYGCSLEQEVSPERLRAHFSKRGDSYQLRQAIRELCVFASHDVTRDPPYSQIDLVSCRNLMIYLSRELQARVLGLIHYALRNDGFLLLGTSETTSAATGFASVDAKSKIYRRLPVGPAPAIAFRSPRVAGFEPLHWSSVARVDVLHEADRVVLSRFGPAGVVVTEELEIIQFRGSTASYLASPPGIPRFELLRMVRDELRAPLKQALEEARQAQRSVRREQLPLLGDGAPRAVDIDVIPFTPLSTKDRFFIVLFCEPVQRGDGAVAPAAAVAWRESREAAVITELREELASNRGYLNGIIEQLETSNEKLTAANEEIICSNEELQTANEELQQAKEELQATNNELSAINEELALRNAEAIRLGNDLENVLTSVEIPIVLLGRDGRIRRFAPAAAAAFRLTAADIGRALGEVEQPLAVAAAALARAVLTAGGLAERALQDGAGRWHQLTARPYVTLEDQLEGAVITAFDIDAIKRSAEHLAEAQQYAESILETVRECLVVVDGERRVRSANRAFYERFGLSAQAAAGRRLSELAIGTWMEPGVERFLAALAAGDAEVEGRVELQQKGAEPLAFLVNAVKLPGGPHIRLSFIDITERELARKALARSEAEFFDVLATAAVGILITDTTGQILFANAELGRIFGYAAQELSGERVEVLVPDALRTGHARLREQYLSESLRRRMGSDRELVGRRKDGSDVAIEVTLSPLVRNTSRLVVSFVTDVTAAREAQSNILRYQHKLQQMAFEAALSAEGERRRIANDLHDRIGQALSFAEMRLKSARGSDTAKDAAMDEAIALLARSSEDVRTLVFELSPPILYDLGLEAAISWLADDLGRRSGVNIRVEAEESPTELPEKAAGVVFRAVRELLTNVIKHAQAPAAHVSIRRSNGRLVIQVEDRGIGFDAQCLGLDTDRSRFGLFSVREQLRRLGGTLTIDSVEQHGTRVCMELPLQPNGSGVLDEAAGPVGRDSPAPSGD